MLLYMLLYINLQVITGNMYACCGCVHTGEWHVSVSRYNVGVSCLIPA